MKFERDSMGRPTGKMVVRAGIERVGDFVFLRIEAANDPDHYDDVIAGRAPALAVQLHLRQDMADDIADMLIGDPDVLLPPTGTRQS